MNEKQEKGAQLVLEWSPVSRKALIDLKRHLELRDVSRMWHNGQARHCALRMSRIGLLKSVPGKYMQILCRALALVSHFLHLTENTTVGTLSPPYLCSVVTCQISSLLHLVNVLSMFPV